jgi:hypothetical protein
MMALQEACEFYLVGLLEDTNLCAIHARCVTHHAQRHPAGMLHRRRTGLGLTGSWQCATINPKALFRATHHPQK